MAASPYRIRCSGLDRVLACPGSLQMEEKHPQAEETDAAKEGTAAHDCFAMDLEGLQFKVGDTAHNGVVITAEMIEAAGEFADFVRSWATPYTYIERQMPCASIHPLCGGTPDAWGWIPEQNLIRLADLKFGHRDVAVFDNGQLAGYTAGIMDEMKINGLMDQHIRFEWTIYQPRAYRSGGPWKTHTGFLSDLRPLINSLRAAAAESVSAAPSCRPSAQCRDCTGRHACVALQRASASAIDFTANTLEDFTLSADQCGRELSRLELARQLLESRIEGLTEQATSAIRSGKRVPGYELQSVVGREVWRDGKAPAEIAATAELMGFDVYKPKELITPNQARKMGFDVDLFDLSVKPTTGVKLTPVDINQTRKIFGA